MQRRRAGFSLALRNWCPSVGGDVNGLARGYDGLCSAKDSLDLAFENNERFFKVVAVRRGSASRRNVHVDQAKALSGVLAAQKCAVGVANQADVQQVGTVCLADGEVALGIVGRNGSGGPHGAIGFVAHSFLP